MSPAHEASNVSLPTGNIDEARFVGVILGGALGDALGWPQEDRARNVSDHPSGQLTFQTWVKRSGGRFMPHDELIGAGSYSDDTQLTIAVARSRLNYDDWWSYFARSELPLWTLYERGGGGATLRAAKLWSKGVPPWNASGNDLQKYFDAGGNGAAMRIAPHVLLGAEERSFEAVAKNVIADAVATHGHPQAIVGALGFAYALWIALRHKGTLEYGQLLQAVLEDKKAWSSLPDIDDFWPGWLVAAQNTNFEQHWADAVEDFKRQIEVGYDSLSNGALSFDQETLEKIGCFNKRILGAGTIAASAAIYLASRYAAGPMEGVLTAAYSRGADTDTIASMTGALSGAISGSDWLGSIVLEVQDAPFLDRLARDLRTGRQGDVRFKPIGQRDLAKIVQDLSAGMGPILPVGFPTVANETEAVKSKAPNLTARAWAITGRGTPSITIKRISRSSLSDATSQTPQLDLGPDDLAPHAAIAGIELYTTDLDVAVTFYHRVVGLPIERRGTNSIQLGTHLALRKNMTNGSTGQGTIIYVQVANLENCLARVRQSGVSASDIMRTKSRIMFTCSDPDGRTVEIFQR